MRYLSLAKNHTYKVALKAIKRDFMRFLDARSLPAFEPDKTLCAGANRIKACPGYVFHLDEGCTALKGAVDVICKYASEGYDLIYGDYCTARANISKIKPLGHVFLPDFSPEALEDNVYFGGFYALREGVSLDSDLEKIKAVHISEILYAKESRICKKSYPLISEFEFEDRKVSEKKDTDTAEPLVSIIIPNKDHIEDLKRCLDSIINRTSYENYEILIVENNSISNDTFNFYDGINDERIKVITYDKAFNYSDINNYGAGYARGEFLLLLNNDTKVISRGWLNELVAMAKKTQVGAVGALLLYPDDTVQHCGVIVGIGPDKTAVHPDSGVPYEEAGYRDNIHHVCNYSAVTGACLMVRKELYESIGGLDTSFAVAYNDIDFCLRLAQAGYRNVYTPGAVLYHYESASRGLDTSGERYKRHQEEAGRFREKWSKYLSLDPYYNKNLSRSIPWQLSGREK